MSWTPKTVKIDNLFIVQSGDYHAAKELDDGNVPLISCGDFDNGLVGYFDIPEEKTYQNCITVAYNGQPLLAKFHPYKFGAKDDVAVIIPRATLSVPSLLYIAAQINTMKWRYSYGRKCFREKLRNVKLPLPIIDNTDVDLDQDYIEGLFTTEMCNLLPPKGGVGSIPLDSYSWRSFNITEFFRIERGGFHSISALDTGNERTVSRITQDNGTVGYFERPDKAERYPSGRITVSTVGGDAFVQLTDFIATDNVLVLTPLREFRNETLFFIVFSLNRGRWRYSYGRQCYKTKFEATTSIWLPVNEDGNILEAVISTFVQNTPYSSEVISMVS